MLDLFSFFCCYSPSLKEKLLSTVAGSCQGHYQLFISFNDFKLKPEPTIMIEDEMRWMNKDGMCEIIRFLI